MEFQQNLQLRQPFQAYFNQIKDEQSFEEKQTQKFNQNNEVYKTRGFSQEFDTPSRKFDLEEKMCQKNFQNQDIQKWNQDNSNNFSIFSNQIFNQSQFSESTQCSDQKKFTQEFLSQEDNFNADSLWCYEKLDPQFENLKIDENNQDSNKENEYENYFQDNSKRTFQSFQQTQIFQVNINQNRMYQQFDQLNQQNKQIEQEDYFQIDQDTEFLELQAKINSQIENQEIMDFPQTQNNKQFQQSVFHEIFKTNNQMNLEQIQQQQSQEDVQKQIQQQQQEANEKKMQDYEKCEQQNFIKNEIQSINQIPSSNQQNNQEFEQFQFDYENSQNLKIHLHKDTLSFLIQRENQYLPDPNYFQKHKELNSLVRAILLDWMMEVSQLFYFKRETFYLGINILDRYLSVSIKQIKRNQLQLIGATALFIACKQEEVLSTPIEQFITATDNSVTQNQICETELEILMKLKFLLNPPTIQFWSSLYLGQWDFYLQQTFTQDILESIQIVEFKQQNELSYNNYRELMQLIDFSQLDSNSMCFNSRALIAAFMYLIIGKNMRLISVEDIQNFQNQKHFIEENNILNNMFQDFLRYSFRFLLQDLIDHIQYASKFFILPILNDYPTIYYQKLNEQDQESLLDNYHEFLSFQTQNVKQLEQFKILKQKQVI